MARVINCADCGERVETKAWNRVVCNDCGISREAARRKDWWKRHPTYAHDRYHGDIERHRKDSLDRARARDPEEVRLYQRERYYADHEATLERQREYYAENKVKIARSSRAWRARNRETVAEYERQYRKEHREQRRADFQRWRAALHGADGTFSASEFVALCEASGWRCVYCDTHTKHPTADHMVPLSRGGSNSIDNIAPACKSCNSSKGAKTPSEFAAWLAEVSHG